MHERSYRFWFCIRYEFLSNFWFLSLCFYASYILSSPEQLLFGLIVVVFFVFLPVPTLTQWEWLILCAKMWQYRSRGSFVKVISASNLLSWMTANFQEVCQSWTFTWCVLHVFVCPYNMFFKTVGVPKGQIGPWWRSIIISVHLASV